jgi:hypothetical protein
MEHLITVSVNSPSAGVLKYRGRHLAGRHASLPARGQTFSAKRFALLMIR